MAQPQLLQVKLSRFDAQPWGFRLQGGADFAAPLLVQKVNAGSLAEQAGLIPGDAVIKINDVDVFNLRHKDAQDIVVRSGNNFVLTIQRGGSTWRPHVTPTGQVPIPQQNSPYLQTVTKTSLAHKQQDSQHIGCGYNNSARPFANGGDGNVKSIVNKQYNTPVGIYSDESIAETLSAQAEVLAGGVLGVNFKKNEREYQGDKSEVLKFLREEETGDSAPVFSSHPYQEPQQQHYQPSATKHVSAPINTPKPPSTGGLPVGQNICFECERLITGVFVRIKDKNLHVECFKCATCGTSLKNQGYYNFNNKLYCEIHAKLAAMQNPPPGTDGYVPVPIRPNTKLSANTVSTALSAHGFGDIPAVNGNSAPSGGPTSAETARHAIEDTAELPLPPPPSPTQLKQIELGGQYLNCDINNTKHAKHEHNEHTRTNDSIPSHSRGSSTCTTPQAAAVTASGGLSTVDGHLLISPNMSVDGSPVLSLDTANTETYATSKPPPPPPPPMPMSTIQHTTNDHHHPPASNVPAFKIDCQMSTQKQENILANRSLQGAVYGKFLKEFSDKLLTPNNNSHTNNTSPHSTAQNRNHSFHNSVSATNKNTDILTKSCNDNFELQQPSQASVAKTNVAAVSAALANQLKFNPCQQVSNPTSTTISPSSSTGSAAPTNQNQNQNQNDTILTKTSSCDHIYNNNTTSNSVCTLEEAGSIDAQANAAMLTDQLPSAFGCATEEKPFSEYLTLTGNVIRSVAPPGKGPVTNYKVNQGYARPYGVAAAPPMAAPKSPVSYPPQKPMANPYATLPRANVGPQGRRTYNSYNNNYNKNYSAQYSKPVGGTYGSNKYATMPSYKSSQYSNYKNNLYSPDPDVVVPAHYAESGCGELPAGADYFEEDHEVADSNRQNRANFMWPPPNDDSHTTPTAAPLYIAPPETQHVIPKPAIKCEQKSTEKNVDLQNTEAQGQPNIPSQIHWQSYSAPQLSNSLQPPEIESSSESFTSTSTTTTTTTEEYNRMYAAQVQAYQMQQAYEQYVQSELDYQAEMEINDARQQQNELYESLSGRRSASECIESLAAPLSTYKLIDMVREVTPSPVPTSVSQGPRHVFFADEPQCKIDSQQDMMEEERDIESNTAEKNITGRLEIESQYSETSFEKEDVLIKEDRTHILENQRIFQPTPEIKIEIAPVRRIPPTKIPNPVPKEWINPMIRALTTAPSEPFHMVEAPSSGPISQNCEELIKATPESTINEAPQVLSELPPQGGKFSKAITIASEYPLKFQPASCDIPLPEQTEPYMPPPIDMKPYMREDYRPKSPFVSALTTAPERPFEGHFDRDVPIHLLDLPTPKEHLTMSDALRTASDRAYTPLNPENATVMFAEQEKEKQKKKYEFQVIDQGPDDGKESETVEYFTTEKHSGSQTVSSFAAMQAFQTHEPTTICSPRHSVISLSKDEPDQDYTNYYKAKERNKKRLDFYHKKEVELQQQQAQEETLKTDTLQPSSLSSYTSTKQSSSFESSSTVQQLSTSTIDTFATKSNQDSRLTIANEHRAVSDLKLDVREIIEETSEELEQSEVLFPPPSPLSHLRLKPSSGLHKADTIPKYQRNWTVLPTQSPIRTPEPQELRENVPLAFVDTPKTINSGGEAVYKPVARTTAAVSSVLSATSTSSTQHLQAEQTIRQQTGSQLSKSQQIQQQRLKSTIPIIVEDRSAPVTMAFQSLDEHAHADESQTPCRPYTPSLNNKPQPIIPYYQTPEKLCFDECPAAHARAYDRRSASPFPDRARSPAPGPPPNPLAAIRAPQMKDNEFSPISSRVLQAGSITTGKSYLGAQQTEQQEQHEHQTQLISQYENSAQTRTQNVLNKPEKTEESSLFDQKQSSIQSQQITKSGNIEVARKRQVTEEFEHVRNEKTIELHCGSSQMSTTERRQSYGKTGYVANQARRLSNLEQEITNLTTQSQAISARAANLGDTTFPQLRSQEPVSKFPTKPVLPPHDEPTAQSYFLSPTSNNKMVGPPPGFMQQYSQQQKELCLNPTNKIATLPPQSKLEKATGSDKSNPKANSDTNNKSSGNIQNIEATQDILNRKEDVDATAMLTESIGKIYMGDKMDNFMAEANKIILNMLEARLCSTNSAGPSSHNGSVLSLRSSNNSTPTRSPMLVRKRFDLDDFKSIDPTEPVALQPVITLQQPQQHSTQIQQQVRKSPVLASEKLPGRPLNTKTVETLTTNLPKAHPMSKLLALGDVKTNISNTTGKPQNSIPLPSGNESVRKVCGKDVVESAGGSELPSSATEPQCVVYRLKTEEQHPACEVSTHDVDRRSYIEPNVISSDNTKDDLNFSINIKALGPDNPKALMSSENKDVVNQLLRDGKRPVCCQCKTEISKGPFITALGRIWCPEHFICVNGNCRRPLQDIGFVEEKGDLYCEYCFEKYLAPTCSKCGGKIKGDCLNAIGKQFHPECFTCAHCGKLFGNTPFFLEDGNAYCEADWNELFTTKCFACGFPVEAGDRWVEALNHNYHSQCFNCTYCKQNLEGQSFYNKGGRPFCKNHAR